MKAKNKPTYLISDLHLEIERPDITQAFLSFVDSIKNQASALYILGDFFNVWIGDDNKTEFNQLIASSLKSLSSKECNIYLMHGNRDFLIGEDFAQSCGASLIHEPYLLKHLDQNYLLLHGDSLCTLDESYMQFRAMVRNPQWQKTFLDQTVEQRQAFADQARAQSKTMSSNKADDIMDVTPSEVVKIMNANHITQLIHGHTHRPNIHDVDLEQNTDKALTKGTTATRTVLGDWDKGVSYLILSDQEPQLIANR